MLNASKDNESITCGQRKIMKSEEIKDGEMSRGRINIFYTNSPFQGDIGMCIYFYRCILRSQIKNDSSKILEFQ